jgi:hypothetical protein
MPASRRTLTAALAAMALFATGCKKEAPPPAPAPPAPAPAPAPAPLAVAGVDLGKAIDATMKVAAPQTTFGVRDTIYASVRTTGAGSNATIGAKWTFVTSAGKEVAVNESSQTISPTADAVTEFHITKASAWPKGKYHVAITLNGAAAGAGDFTVQ